jgi:hypothetical protein
MHQLHAVPVHRVGNRPQTWNDSILVQRDNCRARRVHATDPNDRHRYSALGAGNVVGDLVTAVITPRQPDTVGGPYYPVAQIHLIDPKGLESLTSHL